MNNTKNTAIKYLVTTGIALLGAIVILWSRNFIAIDDLAQKFRALADAFCVPGVILMCFSGLIWVSSDGFFDGLGYAFSRVGGMFIPAYKAKHETFLDYKQKKHDKRAEKNSGSLWFVFFVGLGFFLVSLVFTLLYNLNFAG